MLKKVKLEFKKSKKCPLKCSLICSPLEKCYGSDNRPFPISKKSHFQNEAKCETFVVKMSFICITIKNHFHINSFVLSLALKVRFFGSRKWPIPSVPIPLGLKLTECLTPLMSFICMSRKNNFHINGFALGLAIEQRLGVTRKKARLPADVWENEPAFLPLDTLL